jgi:phage baseplate assembly protein W
MSNVILSDNTAVVRAKVAARAVPYSDLDPKFKPHALFGDVIPLKDINAIKNSIKNLLLTGYGERLFQPHLGCGITNYLFEPLNPISIAAIRQNIERTLKYQEPRASLVSIIIKDLTDTNELLVSLSVKILNVPELIDIELYLERLR